MHRSASSKVVQARRDRAERVAVLEVVALEPARADAEDHATARDVVDGARHVGEQVRIAVRVAADERAELHALRHLRERGEQRPALEVRAVGVAVQRVEVIPDVDAVDAEILGAQPRLPQLGEARLLRVKRGPTRIGATAQLSPESEYLSGSTITRHAPLARRAVRVGVHAEVLLGRGRR